MGLDPNKTYLELIQDLDDKEQTYCDSSSSIGAFSAANGHAVFGHNGQQNGVPPLYPDCDSNENDISLLSVGNENDISDSSDGRTLKRKFEDCDSEQNKIKPPPDKSTERNQKEWD